MNTSESAGSSRSTTKKYHTFHGVRGWNKMWAAEIDEPRKPSLILLGTYPTAEMAAAAYDVAALALKGSDAVLNFPELARYYQLPESPEPALIKSAAAEAADLMKFMDDILDMSTPTEDIAEGMIASPSQQQTIDESSSGNLRL
ncbi:unnamed protein product [Lactuca saligna]|uniref:AP2/ERF domain-containing protein n=1 Tax=Lactuca saligna TaxID=75948 RepID=A0AA35VXL3_LACSI|nr:unnamed protein product [Lactuca saligna]